MKSEYWRDFWLEYTKSIDDKDEQTQVLRVRNKQPISQELWQFTIEDVMRHLPPGPQEDILDLCCGNGLFSVAYSASAKSITAVDLSPQLIKKLNDRNIPNVKGVASDIRDVSYPTGSFSRILWYAGIQYLDEPDIITMMRKIRGWLKKDGILFVGDIADRDKLWEYFNNDERQGAYFKSVEERKPIIGAWLQKEWLERLVKSCGFDEVRVIPQDSRLIYSDFRYDLRARA